MRAGGRAARDALAARAPDLHNGAAATPEQVIEFDSARFRMALTGQQKADLAAFLGTL